MVPFQNPSVYIGGLRIDEPVTTLTDFLFAAVCLFAYFNTKEHSHLKGPNLYRWFFLGTGISAIISALMGHAFLYRFGFGAKIIGWEANVLGASVAQFAAIYHTRRSISETSFRRLLLTNYVEVILALALTAVIFSFIVVEIHTAYGLLGMVTVLEIIHYRKTGSVLSRNMLIGVGIAVLAVLVHIFKLAISVWFNHLDLSHIIMCIAMYVMYRGVKYDTEKTM
jgi:hypothetical protein